MEGNNKYIILNKHQIKMSDVVNDCTGFCVPVSNGEALSSILKKICRKIEEIKNQPVRNESDPIFTGSPSFGIGYGEIQHWNIAYNKSIVSIDFTGADTKTLTIHFIDGSSTAASFDDISGLQFIDGITNTDTIELSVIAGTLNADVIVGSVDNTQQTLVVWDGNEFKLREVSSMATRNDLSVISNRISVIDNSLSVEIGNRVTGDLALNNAISAVSNALSTERDSRISADNALSERIDDLSIPGGVASVTSQDLSIEIASRVSADNALSLRINSSGGSVTSQEFSVLSARVNVNSSQMISADTVLSNAISVVAQSVSVISSQLSNTQSAIQANSAHMVSVDLALGSSISTETSARIAGDNSLSNTISVIRVELPGVNVLDFGAIADWNGTTGTDNTTAFQNAVNFAQSNSINRLYIPLSRGQRYLINTKINITSGNFSIYGDAPVQNLANSQMGYVTGATAMGALFDYGNDQNITTGALYVDGVAFYKTGSVITTAVKVSMDNNGPHRGITFRNCSFKGFTNAIELNPPTPGNLSAANVDIESCNFTGCTNAVNAVDEAFGLRFVGNQSEAGGNIIGKFSSGVTITDNMLESNTNCVNIDSNAPNVIFENNYLEACDGDYVMRVKGGNGYTTLKIGENAVLDSTTATDQYLVEGVIRVDYTTKHYKSSLGRRANLTFKDSYLLPGTQLRGEGFYIAAASGFRGYLDYKEYPLEATPPNSTILINTLGSTSLNTPYGPTSTGMAISGYNATNDQTFTITYATTDYLVFTALLNVTNGANEKLYAYFFNQASTQVGSAGEIRFMKAWDQDWYLFTTVIKPSAAGTSLRVRFGPNETTVSPSSTVNVAAIGLYKTDSGDTETFNTIDRIYVKPFVPFRAQVVSSLTSADLVSIQDRISGISANVTSIQSVLSNYSAKFVSVNSAISVNSAQMTSADNVLSNAISIVSQALSIETAARITANNSISNAVSIVSAAAKAVNDELNSVKNVVSVHSQQISVLSARVNANSAQMTSADNAISQAVSIVSIAAANALSIANVVSNAVSIVSQALSVEIANRISADNVLSQGISVISQSLSVEIVNRTSADNALSTRIDGQSQGISVLSQQISVISQQLSALSQNLSANSVVLSNTKSAVIANSAQMTSADNAISNAVSIVSAAANAVSVDLASVKGVVAANSADVTSVKNAVSVLSQAVSVLSQTVSAISVRMDTLSNAVSVVSADMVSVKSVIAANSADVTSIKDRVSANSATLSNALSAIVANSSQMTSADNAISNAVSIVSAAQAATSADLTSVKNAVSIISQALSAKRLVSLADVSTLSIVDGQVLVWKSASAQWVNSTTTGGAASVTSAELDVVSNAVSIVSVAQAATSAAVTSVNQAISVISQQISVLSARVAGVSAQMTSADNAISNAVSIVSVVAANATSIAQAASNAVSVLSVIVSNQGSAIVANSAQMTSANNAISNAVSIVSVAVAAVSADLTSVKNVISVHSQAISVLSQQVSVISQALSVETAIRIANDNTISNAVSIVSVAAANATSIANAASNAVSVLSVIVSNQGSAIAANSADVTSVKNVVSILSQAISVLSQQVSALSQNLSANSVVLSNTRSAVVANSAQMTSADNAISQAISVETAARIAADNTISNAVSIVSAATLSVQSVVSTLQFQAVETIAATGYTLSAGDNGKFKIFTNVGAISVTLPNGLLSGFNCIIYRASGAGAVTLSATTSVEAQGLTLTNDKTGVAVLNKGTDLWIAQGALTSANIDVLSNAISIISQQQSVQNVNIAAVSNAVSALSVIVSNQGSAIAANSADVTSIKNIVSIISQQISVISAGLGAPQLKVVQNIQGLSGTALTNISGLSASVTSGAVYQVEGMVIYKMSVANTMGFGLTFPAGVTAGGKVDGDVSVGGVLSTTVDQIAYFDETASGSILYSVTPATTTTHIIFVNALFQISTTAGTIQLQARTSVTTSPINIQKGSFLRAYKIG